MKSRLNTNTINEFFNINNSLVTKNILKPSTIYLSSGQEHHPLLNSHYPQSNEWYKEKTAEYFLQINPHYKHFKYLTIHEHIKDSVEPNSPQEIIVKDNYKISTALQGKLRVLDLLSGVGGCPAALKGIVNKSGAPVTEVVFAVEIKDEAREIYNVNFPEVPLAGNIYEVPDDQFPKAHIVVAGFPCQTFSSAGLNAGFDRDTKQIFKQLLRATKASGADVVLLENVRAIRQYEDYIFNKFLQIGFKCTTKCLNSVDFGLAQKRKRWFLVAIKIKSRFAQNILEVDGKISFEFPTHTIPDNYTRILYDALEPNGAYTELKATSYISEILCNYYQQLEKDVNNTTFFHVGETTKRNGNTLKIYCGFINGCSKGGPYRKQKNPDEPPKMFSQINFSSPTYHFFDYTASAHTLVSSVPCVAPLGCKLKPRELANLQGFPTDFIFPKNIAYSHYMDGFGNTFPVPVVRKIIYAIMKQIFGMDDIKIKKSEKEIPLREKINHWTNKLAMEMKEQITQEKIGFVPALNLTLDEAREKFRNAVKKPVIESILYISNQQYEKIIKKFNNENEQSIDICIEKNIYYINLEKRSAFTKISLVGNTWNRIKNEEKNIIGPLKPENVIKSDMLYQATQIIDFYKSLPNPSMEINFPEHPSNDNIMTLDMMRSKIKIGNKKNAKLFYLYYYDDYQNKYKCPMIPEENIYNIDLIRIKNKKFYSMKCTDGYDQLVSKSKRFPHKKLKFNDNSIYTTLKDGRVVFNQHFNAFINFEFSSKPKYSPKNKFYYVCYDMIANEYILNLDELPDHNSVTPFQKHNLKNAHYIKKSDEIYLVVIRPTAFSRIDDKHKYFGNSGYKMLEGGKIAFTIDKLGPIIRRKIKYINFNTGLNQGQKNIEPQLSLQNSTISDEIKPKQTLTDPSMEKANNLIQENQTEQSLKRRSSLYFFSSNHLLASKNNEKADSQSFQNMTRLT